MKTAATDQVTRLLLAWSDGDAAAGEPLMALVYEELRDLARSYLRQEHSESTLQTTGLVHEAYLRLVDSSQIRWQSRAHFYGIAARLMRQILVDHARRQKASKRGGDVEKIPLEKADDVFQEADVDLVALDGALENLAKVYPRQGNVVELKFFGGLDMREISEFLQVSERTVLRDWEFARRWLKRELDSGESRRDP